VRISIALLAAALVLAATGCGVQTDAVERTGTWSRVEPSLAGVDPARLGSADRFAETHVPALTSLLVARHGSLVLERYYHGGAATEPVPVFSVTKSVVSTLVGIALGQRRLRSLDMRVADVLPDQIPHDADPQVRSITLRQLLTMTAGFGSEATDPFAGGNEFRTAPSWVRSILGSLLTREPGTGFSYDNGDAHLVSAILQRAVGVSAAEFARRHLFGPLRIAPPKWTSDRQGISDGAAGLWLLPRDMAKLGELYLRRGRWAGRQLVPASYVDAATTQQVAAGQNTGGLGYGYLWWTFGGTNDITKLTLALGSGGQMVIVAPSEDAVVVMTSDAETDRPPPEQLELARRVLNAIRPATEAWRADDLARDLPFVRRPVCARSKL
jgi:CubicO group peptidase (beta-lactamase class C family)